MENIDVKQGIEKAIKQEWERIGALIEDKIEAINVICEKKWDRAQERNKTKRKGSHRKKQSFMSLGRTEAIKLFEHLKFNIENPNYVRKFKNPEREAIS